jgi:hypothetical protein
VFPREPECMRDLRLVTDKHPLYVLSLHAPTRSCFGFLIELQIASLDSGDTCSRRRTRRSCWGC